MRSANLRRIVGAEPPRRQAAMREYVEAHEDEPLYAGPGEAALLVDANIYADAVENTLSARVQAVRDAWRDFLRELARTFGIRP